MTFEAPRLSVDSMNSLVVRAEYAVRGPVVARASEISEEIKRGKPSSADTLRSFEKIISCNIGNPHALKQKPLTYVRQILALCSYPELINSSPEAFPRDVLYKAAEFLAGTNGGIGAYTETEGLAVVRNKVSKFIEARDGYPADSKTIMLTSGASEGIKRIIQSLLRNREQLPKETVADGIMIPCPQYPLYSCQITLCGGSIVYYDLEEEKRWSISQDSLLESFNEATARGICVRAITVINPGNPTGNLLAYEDIKTVIEFAAQRNLVILADEVYQANVYRENAKFFSFKKVLRDLQRDGGSFKETQLVSFHSTSKGLIGECGLRGGYMELIGFDSATFQEIKKLAASSLSGPTLGQIACGAMVDPPKPGEESYDLYQKETLGIFESLSRRAKQVERCLNSIPGFSCQPIDGAMYAFPRIEIPTSIIKEAERRCLQPDELYCMKLVEDEGLVAVPGSGFGQRKGTWHMRLTILPAEEDLENVLERIRRFHIRLV